MNSKGKNHKSHHTQSLENVNSKDLQYKVQIVVAPIKGSRDSAEIRIMGGTANKYIANENDNAKSEFDASQQQQASGDTSPLEACMKGSNKMLAEQFVIEFLSNTPDFLEKYVMNEIEIEQLEHWIIRKSQRLNRQSEVEYEMENDRKTSLSRWKFCVHADKRQMLQDLTTSLELRPSKDHVLWELANCISSAVNADGFKLFTTEKLPDSDSYQLFTVVDSDTDKNHLHLEKVKKCSAILEYVAKTKEIVRLSKGQKDPRFPSGVKIFDEGEISHIQCQPIIQPNGELVALLELWRGSSTGAFFEEDEEIVCSYLVWGGIALHYAQLFLNMSQQRQLNDFLLAVVKSIFQDMVSMDTLVMKIMNFAQRLVTADRASLFLVDNKNKELYATIFDVGVEEDIDELCANEGSSEYSLKVHTAKEIRFPLGMGIAGQVATSGEILNIKDAYSDKRFNRTVDQLTGYKTKTILCMPIYIRGSIIGVVQMVNKQNGHFTKDDEAAFETFAIYCGLALHHAKLYDKIKKSEQKYKVALEVLSYHNTCTEEEFQTAVKDGIPQLLPGVDDYYFNPFQIDDYQKAQHSIFMFIDLFGLVKFDKNSLIRFVLTVRKNYRRVPYHNWTHGFSVAHSMYCILKRAEGCFRTNEGLALFIGALCHDLDHRGKNNKFMSDTESPLAAIYSTSTMEHHHFNQTVTILQQRGHNIFGKLSSNDYKEVLGLLKHCIIATDLAVFFPNKAKLAKIVEEQKFSWNNMEHRRLLQAISMTGSDLSASAKPWDVQVKTVKIIFEEFYQQGDAEKEAGRHPIPMMDREQPDQQPASQVGFLTGICLPCYKLLNELIPECKPLLEMCQNNLEQWKKIDEEIQESKEEDDDDDE